MFVFFEILCYLLPLNPGTRCFIKPTVWLFIYALQKKLIILKRGGGKVTLNLYIDGCICQSVLWNTSWSPVWLTEQHGPCSRVPALFFTGSRWCSLEALWAPGPASRAWASCHLCSHLGCWEYFLRCRLKIRQKVLTPFAHLVFCYVQFV